MDAYIKPRFYDDHDQKALNTDRREHTQKSWTFYPHSGMTLLVVTFPILTVVPGPDLTTKFFYKKYTCDECRKIKVKIAIVLTKW